MSRARVDLSVLPIDVGFDLRLHDIVVAVAADTTSAAYDSKGVERIVRGTTADIVAALQAAGYRCEPAGAGDPIAQAASASADEGLITAEERDSLFDPTAAAIPELRRLRRVLRNLHDQVDQTDPNDPIGVALTRAGCARRP